MQLKKTTAFLIAISAHSNLSLADETSQHANAFRLNPLNAQDKAIGSFEGQRLSGFTRNWYSRERSTGAAIFKYNNGDGTRTNTHSRDTWVQGTLVDYTSGFTKGTVGFGLELAGFNVVALERSKRSVAGPNNRTLTDSDSDVVDQWSKLGIANLKARISNTTLVAGRQSMATPVLADYNNRVLPSSFDGISITSKEFENLDFTLGSFDRVSPRNEQSLTGFRGKYGSAAVESGRVSIAGLTYRATSSLSASAFSSQMADIWKQHYVGLTHTAGSSKTLGVSTSINYYKTSDAGKAKLGKIDNQAYSLALTATHLAHSLTLAYQQVDGNEYFDYINETSANYLANAQYSDFNGPNERSSRVTYALDMYGNGFPGLKLSIYTARGWGIDGTHYQGSGYNVKNLDGEHHYEHGVGASYVVQAGPLEGSNLKAFYFAHRGSKNQIDGRVNELRIITTVPFELL
ncbi:OprD family outer membrane porin [Pseudomonas alloputida]|uniref:OprD family outer membrane porin n=1 Tax=Pseudomonas TaxID=286 RepID=UPI003EF0693E